MNSFLIKTYIELGYLVINKEINTKSFADEFNLSNYELKKDIEAISELGRNAGILIQVRDDNIYYDIVDETLYDKYKRNFPVFYYNNRHHDDNEDMFLSSFIIKYFILHKDSFITVEELADLIGFSKSKLRNPIKLARSNFEQYGFTLQNVSHHGMIFKNTDEYMIRLCLTMQYLTFDIRCFYNKEVDKSFNYFFSCYSDVLNIIDKAIEKSKRSIVKSERKKLAYFLMIQASRIYYHHYLDTFDNIEALLLNKINSYEEISNIASEIAKGVSSLYRLNNYFQREIDYICILLVVTMGFPDIANEIINELYIDEKEELYNLVFNFLEYNYGLKIGGIYKNSIEITINNLLVKKKINVLNAKGMAVNGRSFNYYKSPLANKIVRDLNNELVKYFHENIPITQMADLIDILIIYLSSLKIDYIRPNIAITSRNSNFEPLLVKEMIQNEISDDTYGKLDIIEYDNIYPENIENVKDYDIIFCDQKLVYDDRLKLYNDRLLKVENINQIIKKSRDYYHRYLANEDLVANDYDFKTLMDIAKKYNDEYTIINNVLFMIRTSTKNKLYLGNINNSDIKNYVILEMNNDKDNVAFFHILLAKLANDYNFLLELISGNRSVINDMMIDANY